MTLKVKVDHVSLLVEDLDKAVNDWKEMLSVLSPEMLDNIVFDSGEEGGEKMRWATFQNPHPEGCSIQLFQPMTEDGFLMKVLKKRGEYVHHIAFTTNDIHRTYKELQGKNMPLVGGLVGPDNKDWLKWTFVSPKKAHGVLVEVATSYKVDEEGNWIPDSD